jgi:hypothetical protein
LLLAGGTIWAQQYLITTVAGGTVTPTPASAVSVGLVRPVAAAVDPAGNLYFSDGNCVFKVDHSGILTRVAGTGIAGYSGDNGPATAAQLKLPSGVAVDASGSVYIADAGNSRVRKVTPDGTITTLAGDGTYGYSGDGGPATAAQLQWPTGVGVDAAGDVYIADSDANALRRVTPGGAITTVAVGSGWSVAVDAAGNAYTAVPSGNVVFRIAPDGKTTVVAGVYEAGYSGDGGPATSAQLNNPWGVALDAAGSIYIADAGNHRVRKVAVDGTISTIAGDGTSGSSGDVGPALSARFDPQSVAVDAAGNVYIVDMDNVRLRRVAADGTITTAAGGGNGDSGDGGPATNARLSNPWGLALDGAGNLYIADSYNNRVRKVAADGTIVTVAGNGTAGNSGDGGPAANAQLGIPKGVALDSAGNLYIADLDNSRIRKVGVDGNIATLAAFDHPDSVAVDVGGNLYVADTSSCTVRKVAAGGTISTLVGNTDPKYSAMGVSCFRLSYQPGGDEQRDPQDDARWRDHYGRRGRLCRILGRRDTRDRGAARLPERDRPRCGWESVHRGRQPGPYGSASGAGQFHREQRGPQSGGERHYLDGGGQPCGGVGWRRRDGRGCRVERPWRPGGRRQRQNLHRRCGQ